MLHQHTIANISLHINAALAGHTNIDGSLFTERDCVHINPDDKNGFYVITVHLLCQTHITLTNTQLQGNLPPITTPG